MPPIKVLEILPGLSKNSLLFNAFCQPLHAMNEGLYQNEKPQFD